MKYLNYLNYLFLSGYLDKIPERLYSHYVPKNTFIFLKRFFALVYSDFKKIFRNIDGKSLDEFTWIVYYTKNNYDVLKNLDYKKSNYYRIDTDIVFKYGLLYKSVYVIPLIIRVILRNEYRMFLLYFQSLGLYDQAYKLLKKHKPKQIIMANDHDTVYRALLKAATNLGIKTVYFQHAHVSEFFPPLDFDISFLDGQAALDIYKKTGSIGKVELIGNLKYLPFITKTSSRSKKAIGIAINLLDDISKIEKMIQFLNIELRDYKIILRDHPNIDRKLKLDCNYSISDSKIEDSLSYLLKIDIVIAGNTSILMDAAVMKVKPLYYYPYDDNYYDVYGFVKNNLCYPVNSFEEIIEQVSLNVKPLDIGYYNEKIGYDKVKLILERYSLSI